MAPLLPFWLVFGLAGAGLHCTSWRISPAVAPQVTTAPQGDEHAGDANTIDGDRGGDDDAYGAYDNAPSDMGNQAAIIEQGRSYTKSFYAGRTDRLISQFSPSLRGTLGGGELYEMRETIEKDYGGEIDVLNEEAVKSGTGHKYVRVFRCKEISEPLMMVWLIGSTGEIHGFTVGPFEPEDAEEGP